MRTSERGRSKGANTPVGAPSRRQSPRSEKVVGLSVDPAPLKSSYANSNVSLHGPDTPGGWSAMSVARANPSGFLRQLDIDSGLRLDFQSQTVPEVGLRAWIRWEDMHRLSLEARPACSGAWGALLAAVAEIHCKYTAGPSEPGVVAKAFLVSALRSGSKSNAMVLKAAKAVGKAQGWMESALADSSAKASASPSPRRLPKGSQWSSELAVMVWPWTLGADGQSAAEARAAAGALQAALSAVFGPRVVFEDIAPSGAPESIGRGFLAAARAAAEIACFLSPAATQETSAPRRRPSL